MNSLHRFLNPKIFNRRSRFPTPNTSHGKQRIPEKSSKWICNYFYWTIETFEISWPISMILERDLARNLTSEKNGWCVEKNKQLKRLCLEKQIIPSEILVTKLSAHQFNRFINSKNISRRFDQRKENNKRQTMRNKKESTDIF